MNHPLDNPSWHALTGPHAALALGAPPVMRYPSDISPFMGLADGIVPADLADRVPPDTVVATFAPEVLRAPAGIEIVNSLPILQLVADDVPLIESPLVVEHLTPADSAEMLTLTAITRPGPFALRTIEMGTYLGIRDQGRLVAMTGQRLNLPLHQEVSAVCTHPDHLGHGYARLLVSLVARQILAEGKTPFLHVLPENAGAIAVYRKLGFTVRRPVVATFLRRV